MIPTAKLSWKETEVELEKCAKQFCLIHDMPDVNGEKPRVYMDAALEGVRQRAIQIGWRRIELVRRMYK